ncbi:MAG: hypothetical protein IJ637_03675 [Prevotella sp.]|nr:hypothetical protein [Prevotella sp.]
MKKIFLMMAAFALICACSSEVEPLKYRGLDMSMPASKFVDSLVARGFVVDSAHSDSGKLAVLTSEAVTYKMLVAFEKDKLTAVQENYTASDNDSTRQLWQQMRDDFEKELGTWPNCPKLGDDHKIAKFETDGGFVTITLKNTYTPTLQLLYEVKSQEEGK